MNKKNYLILIVCLIILIILGAYSYLNVEYARNHGVYTIAYVKKIHPAKNGWKVKTTVYYKGQTFQYNHLEFWEAFSYSETNKRFFAKIFIKDNKVKLGFTYIKKQLPDSITVAPDAGWSENWMSEHYPEVVEYVHNTR